MHRFVVDGLRASCVAAAVAILGWVMPGVAAAFTATAETVPDTVAYFGADDPRTTREIEQQLVVRAGPTDEHLELRLHIDEAPRLSAGPLRIEGGGRFGARGPASAASSVSQTGGRGGCETPAAFSKELRYELLLPARSRTTISYTGKLLLARAAASPAVYVQRWQLAPMPAVASSATPPGTVTISSAPVKLTGLQAASVKLRVGVAGSGRSIDEGDRLVVRSRTRLRVGGWVGGAREGDAVTIWAFAPGAITALPLARVRIDRRGRFAYAWRPVRRGTWDLYATYSGREGRVEPARSPCGGPRVRVTR
jgi:hypothetical protein